MSWAVSAEQLKGLKKTSQFLLSFHTYWARMSGHLTDTFSQGGIGPVVVKSNER